MSYILDALKESQQSRDAQAVPDIATIHAVPEPEEEETRSGVPSNVVAAVIILIVLGAGIGWWFAGDVTEPPAAQQAPVQPEPQAIATTPTNTPAPSPIEQASIEPVPIKTPQPQKKTEPVAPEPVTPVAAPVAEAVIPKPAIAPEPKIEQEKIIEQPVAEAVEAPTVAKKPAEKTSAPPVSVVELEEKPEIVAVDLVAESEPTIIEQLPPEQPQTLPTEPVQRTPLFHELPYETQQEIGNIAFSVHLYSPDPARRMVKIDGLVKREGAKVNKGLFVDEITPQGAIFTFKDYRFLVRVR